MWDDHDRWRWGIRETSCHWNHSQNLVIELQNVGHGAYIYSALHSWRFGLTWSSWTCIMPFERTTYRQKYYHAIFLYFWGLADSCLTFLFFAPFSVACMKCTVFVISQFLDILYKIITCLDTLHRRNPRDFYPLQIPWVPTMDTLISTFSSIFSGIEH